MQFARNRLSSGNYTLSGTVEFDRSLSQVLNDNDFNVEINFALTANGSADTKVVFKTKTRPDAPKNLKAAQGDGQVMLTWDKPDDIPSSSTKVAISSYEVRSKTESGSYSTWATISTTSNDNNISHTVTGLTNGTKYTFQVRAVSTNGNGDVSAAVESTPQVPLPGQVTGLKTTEGDGKITLSWTDPGNSSITRYLLASATGNNTPSNFTEIAGSGARTTTHTVEGLTNDTTYSFRLRARNAGGDGAPSETVTATPHEGPDRPQGFKATPGDRQVTLTWDDQSDDDVRGGIGKFQFRQRTGTYSGDGADGTPVTISWGNPGNWVDIPVSNDDPNSNRRAVIGSLANNTPYGYELRAVSAGGSPGEAAPSPEDGPLAATPHQKPVGPQGFSLTPGDGSVTLHWTDKPRNIHNALVTGYQYRQSKDDRSSWGEWEDIPGNALTIREHVVDGLRNGDIYYFAIRAVTAVHEGQQQPRVGSELSTTPDVAPAAPALGVLEPGAGQVKLVWTHTATNTAEVANWQYRQKESGATAWGAWTDIRGSDKDTREYTVGSLQNNTTYDFQVRGKTSGGVTGLPSDPPKSARPAAVPRKPGTPAVEAGDTRVTLTWADPNDVGIDKYQYEKNGDGTWEDMEGSSATTTTYTVTGLANRTAYTFKIRAVSVGGTGPASEPSAPVTPDTAPRMPSNFRLEPGNATITLVWDDQSNDEADIQRWQYQEKVGRDADWPATWTDIGGSDENSTSFERDRLTNGTTYGYRIRAVATGDKFGLPSDGEYATPADAPEAATALTATAGPRRVTLSWTLEPADPSILRWQYQQRVREDQEDQAAPPPTWSAWPADWTDMPGSSAATRSFTVRGLEGDVEHGFRIRAVGYGGDGPVSNIATATPEQASTTPEFDTRTVADQHYTQNVPIPTLQLPHATGGDGTVRYTLAHELPAGLRFNASTRQITGTPTAIQPATIYTYSATDEDYDRATLAFTIEVAADTAPSFADATIADRSWSQGRAGTVQLPAASGGNGALSYTLTPELPAGLRFDASTRQLSGTPTTIQPAASYTYQAADADDDAATLTFTMEVAADTVPSFGDTGLADRSWSQGKTAAVQLPAASGGNGALSYTLTPALPAGLRFDASTRQLSGTPTAVQPATSYTYRAADADDDQAMLAFTIEVVADALPSFADAGLADRSWSQGRTIGTLQLPAASGGNGALSYTLTPELPAGLGFDASTRQITGTPTAIHPATSYTYQAVDRDDDQATLVFTIEVVADTVPSFGDAAIAERSYAQGLASDVLQLPRATGGNGTLSYMLTPELPAGLRFDASTRQLSGTPTAIHPATSYTYRAADRDDDEATLTFTIEVATDTAPSFGGAGIADQSYVLEQAIAALQLPAASGGNGALSYTLTPELPAGLRLDAATRRIVGTPTALHPAATYVWRAVDGDVNRSDADAATLVFTLEVKAPGPSQEKERRVMERTLAAVAQTTLAGAVDTIGQRFDAVPGGAALTLAGRAVGGAAPVTGSERRDGLERPTPAGHAVDGATHTLDGTSHTWDGASHTLYGISQSVDGINLLRDSAFVLPLTGSGEASGGGGWTLWGRGDWRSFEGREAGDRWEGEQRSGWLGVDAHLRGGVMAGLALSRSESESDYRVEEFAGRVETSLTTVWPYIQTTQDDGGTLRVVVGRGEGEAAHRAHDGTVERADLSLLAGSVSRRLPMARWGSLSFSAVGGVSLARIETDGASGASIGGVTATSWRARAGAEAAHEGFVLSPGAGWQLHTRGALALRKDGGDGGTGAGVEMSGGARVSAPGGRFGVDASGYWLALHSEGGTREWGASVEARLRPGTGGRGLSVALGPAWGQQHSGTLSSERLFDAERGDKPQSLSLSSRASYGFTASGGLLTPFAEMTFSGESRTRHYRTGIGFARGAIDAAVTAGHRESSEPDTRIGVDLRLSF